MAQEFKKGISQAIGGPLSYKCSGEAGRPKNSSRFAATSKREGRVYAKRDNYEAHNDVLVGTKTFQADQSSSRRRVDRSHRYDR